ncbi:MAG: asparagine synthase-related protein, partial [Candidatus Acidiferrales bacterium]
SSIVCIADLEIARGAADTTRLDTLSYFDNSEPGWNEFPYFTKVEEKRNRIGCHIDVGLQQVFQFASYANHFEATPTSGGGPSEASRQFAECVKSQGNRVVLSGTGGDEVTGGVPTPTPELENLLVAGRFRVLARQLKIWALSKRRPWFYLLFEAARGFLPPAIVGMPETYRPAPWLNPLFARKHRFALSGYRPRLKAFGPAPTFQENLFALDLLRRQMACLTLPSGPLYEKRYPYLDRDLLEFLYAIPREQLVRPGQRRSLMRRALAGFVPPEILNRKRKAVVARAPTAAISAQWAAVAVLTQQMAASSLGIVTAEDFVAVLENARRGREVPIVPLFRTIAVERWLRNVIRENILQTRVDHATATGCRDGRNWYGTDSRFEEKRFLS